eukprot:3391342-Prymnesium_polylepis.1
MASPRECELALHEDIGLVLVYRPLTCVPRVPCSCVAHPPHRPCSVILGRFAAVELRVGDVKMSHPDLEALRDRSQGCYSGSSR